MNFQGNSLSSYQELCSPMEKLSSQNVLQAQTFSQTDFKNLIDDKG